MAIAQSKTAPRRTPEAPEEVSPHPMFLPSPARDSGDTRREVTVLCSPGADPSESGTFTLGCSVPSSHQHAAVPAQHPCCNIAWEKCNPTVSLLPLGILPLGGQRGCLPSLPGHSTLSEPKTRKVLISPATDRRRDVSVPQKAPSRALLMSNPKRRTWGLLAFRNVPRDSSQEHFAGVNGVLVVSGRQLPAPGAGRFIHSWDKHKQHSVQTSNLLQVSRQIPVFHNRRFRAELQQQQAAAHTPCPFCCQLPTHPACFAVSRQTQQQAGAWRKL